MFGNLIWIILGMTQPLTAAFKELRTILQTNVIEDLHTALEYRRYVKPTHILCNIQLMFSTWFSHCQAHIILPTPDLKNIVTNILMQMYVLPSLPPAQYNLAYPKQTPTIQGLVSAGSNSGDSSSSSRNAGVSSSGASGSSGGASTVSGLTAPTLPQPTRGSAIINLHPNTALQMLLPSNICIKDLIGNTAQPITLDAGGEM